jgi:outer membrane receptor protein involved in Fe transport
MRRYFGGALFLSLVLWSPAGTAASSQPSETVVVTGQLSGPQTLIDRKVYPVATDLQSTFGSAADVLNNIPSVTVDTDGNVSLRNDSNVTILVDGKPSAQFSGATGGLSLLDFPASQIDRIEVMTSPPASLKASGSGGVINIVLKKHRDAGLSGDARLSFGQAGRFVAAGDLAWNSGPLKSSISLGLRQDIRDRRTTDARIVVDPLSGFATASSERLDESIRRLIPSVKGNIQYEIDADDTIGASVSHRNSSDSRHFVQRNTSGPKGAAIDSLSYRFNRGNEWDTYQDQGLSYDRALGKDETLSLSLARSTRLEDENYFYQNVFPLPASSTTFDTLHLGQDLAELDFTADYERTFSGGGKLKLGYDRDGNNNLFDNSGANIIGGIPVPNPVVTNTFRYKNHVDAGYGEFTDAIGPWQLDAGLRYENNRANTHLIGNAPGVNNDHGFYPSVHLNRDLGDGWSVLANVSRRITRPDPEALNPFVDFQDTHNLRAGNDQLLPQDTWLYELGFNRAGDTLNFGATAYYRFDRNSITDVVEPVSADVVLIKKENLPKTHSGGLEFEADGQLDKRLSWSLSGNAFYMQIDARQLGASASASTSGVNLKAEADYKLTGADTLQLTFARTSDRLTAQGTLGATNVLNVGFKHRVSPSTYFVATGSDLLNGQGLHRVIGTTLLDDNYLRLQYGRIVYVGIVYGFGGPLSKKAGEIDYDQ